MFFDNFSSIYLAVSLCRGRGHDRHSAKHKRRREFRFFPRRHDCQVHDHLSYTFKYVQAHVPSRLFLICLSYHLWFIKSVLRLGLTQLDSFPLTSPVGLVRFAIIRRVNLFGNVNRLRNVEVCLHFAASKRSLTRVGVRCKSN